MKKQKRYSAEEKFLIPGEAQEHGVAAACKKHGVDPATCYSWKEKYEAEGKLQSGHRRGTGQQFRTARLLKTLLKHWTTLLLTMDI